MFLKNSGFRVMLLCVVVHQVFLAISTYYIACVGAYLISNDLAGIQSALLGFFGFALMTYLVSAISDFMRVRLKNALWLQLVDDTFVRLQAQQQYATAENKQETMSWLTGEALSAIEEAVLFYQQGCHSYCNVLFTLCVFNYAIGWYFSAIVVSAIILSLALTWLLKNSMRDMASRYQQAKVASLSSMPYVWDAFFYGDDSVYANASKKMRDSSTHAFTCNDRLVLMEQLTACSPIYISVPIVMYMVYFHLGVLAPVLGSAAAVLPRTLQLFGSAHTLSLLNSRYNIMRERLHNVRNFVDSLKQVVWQDLITEAAIEVIDMRTHRVCSFAAFYQDVLSGRISVGRYCIQGSNGAGKSSVLKCIKNHCPQAILLSPGTVFDVPGVVGSTGQKQYGCLAYILDRSDVGICLLDEWDANLDAQNSTLYDRLLDKRATNTLIIEVRHKSQHAISVLADTMDATS